MPTYEEVRLQNLAKARKAASVACSRRRDSKIKKIKERYSSLEAKIEEIDVARIVLASLYLAEGSKGIRRGSLVFGNSDPRIVRLFLKLLRKCYEIDETKFRCTLQCRADQSTSELELFWSLETAIPLTQFYAARVDKRTIGMTSRSLIYKGVCRIDYFSASIFLDLLTVIDIIT